METEVKLQHEVNFGWLIMFALPTILSSIFSSLYTTVDGVFVARWVDTDALSAINITMPMIYLASALGMMFGSGGNALVARKLGEGKEREAQEDFSLLMLVAFAFSVALAVLCFLFLNPLCRFLGSDSALLHYCREYMIPVLFALPFAVFGMVFQLSFITVGKAGFGASLSVIGGVLNIVLDWLFISVFHWGLAGAAIATSIGYAFPSAVGLVWFSMNRKQILHIVRPKWRLKTLVDRGYINGIASVVSYNLGRQDKKQLSNLFRISMWTLGITGIAVMLVSFAAGGTVVDSLQRTTSRLNRSHYMGSVS